MQQSKAAVAGIVAIAGAPVAAGTIAMSGLATTAVGFLGTVSDDNCDGGACLVYFVLGAFIGIVLLDDKSALEFKNVTLDNVKKLGLKKSDIDIYNSELEEVNMLFNEVTSELTKDSTPQEAKRLWNQYSDLVSSETFSVMQALASQK